jgi:hypothetical protein
LLDFVLPLSSAAALPPYFYSDIFPGAIQNQLSVISLKTRNRAKQMHLEKFKNPSALYTKLPGLAATLL